jgi:hypothetical protein
MNPYPLVGLNHFTVPIAIYRLQMSMVQGIDFSRHLPSLKPLDVPEDVDKLGITTKVLTRWLITQIAPGVLSAALLSACWLRPAFLVLNGHQKNKRPC